jgi:hypothetical protein
MIYKLQFLHSKEEFFDYIKLIGQYYDYGYNEIINELIIDFYGKSSFLYKIFNETVTIKKKLNQIEKMIQKKNFKEEETPYYNLIPEDFYNYILKLGIESNSKFKFLINSGKNGVNVKVNKKTDKIIDDGLDKYRRMLKVGVPNQVVFKKLETDIPKNKIKDYITNEEKFIEKYGDINNFIINEKELNDGIHFFKYTSNNQQKKLNTTLRKVNMNEKNKKKKNLILN